MDRFNRKAGWHSRISFACGIAAVALGTVHAPASSAATLATLDQVSAFVDATGLCPGGKQTIQNLGAALVPDIRCSSTAFSATTSALSQYGSLHAFADLRFTGFDLPANARTAFFEAKSRAEYFDTLSFGAGAAIWQVTVAVSGQSVFVKNGTGFDKNVGWCFNLLGAFCGNGPVIANFGAATFDVPIPKNGILDINPSLLIDLGATFQPDANGAPPPTANFDLFADLSHTARFIGSRVLDANGNPIAGATIAAESGFNYLAPVPEPTTLVSLALALGALLVRPLTRHARPASRDRSTATIPG